MSPLFYQPTDRRGRPLPEPAERFRALRTIPRFVRWAWEIQPRLLILMTALRLASAFTPVALLWVGKLIVDGVIENIGSASPDWGFLAALVSLELAIALLSEALVRASSYVETLAGDLISNEVSVRVMRHAGRLDMEQLEDPKLRDRLERARRQAGSRVLLLGNLMRMGQQGVTVVGLVGALVAFEPWLLVILVLAIAPSFLGETRYAGIAYSMMFQWTPERRELEYLRRVASDLGPMKEVKLFGLSSHLVNRFSTLADAYTRENARIAGHRAVTGGVLTAFSTLAYYGAVAFVVRQAVTGAITVGSLTFLIGSFQRTRQLVQALLLSLTSLYEQSLVLTDLFVFLDTSPRADGGTTRLPTCSMTSGIVFDRVSYRYPGARSWALRDVSFEISLGETVAIVGDNGAGKTTLVKLLCRLYQPTHGRILWDGVDLRQYSTESLHEKIGVIFQDFFRYDFTARENISVGRLALRDDMEAIQRAARWSRADAAISRLERGYEHQLGRRFEGGADLSGGEWQRIALARAYMRDAQVLVLDEPTAALDAEAEHDLFARLRDLAAGRITVLISHRFSTVRMADRVLLITRGEVLERGSHRELVTMNGRYAELFRLQAAGYR